MTQDNKNTENVTIVPNSVIYDKELSAKAKGIYATLACLLVNNKEFTFDDILKCSTDRQVSINSGIKELKDKKLLTVYQPKSTGRFSKNVYILNPVL